LIPGEYRLCKENIVCNAGKTAVKLAVLNRGDRPVQIGSHFHFYEVNRALEFNREEAFGMHLNIPAGTAVRFEPGDRKEVEVVPFSGQRQVYGLNNRTNRALD
jgi:urease subunit beta